ncbi:hypothetical protein PG994_011361 [Apiospora phragmitis]|uniref:Uncharacterized protein n=1 Tax=Apiospora phragmitis TaxID=2905665 RepID=A0ABR1TSM6_9PEZI
MALLHHRSAILSTCLIFFPLLWLMWRPPIPWLAPSTQQPIVSIDAARPQPGPVAFDVRPPPPHKHKSGGGGGGLGLSSPRAPFVAWPLKRVCDEQTAAAASSRASSFCATTTAAARGTSATTS